MPTTAKAAENYPLFSFVTQPTAAKKIGGENF
jgi:hypothetical protein